MFLKLKNRTATPFMILTVLFFIFDRVLKNAAWRSGEEFMIIGDIFKFHFARNYHIAFSLPLSGPILNIFVIVIICFLIFYLLKTGGRSGGQRANIGSLSLIIAGAVSNLVDRLYYGYVIDYLDLQYFTVFNIADMMIVGGAAIIIFDHTIFKKRNTKINQLI